MSKNEAKKTADTKKTEALAKKEATEAVKARAKAKKNGSVFLKKNHTHAGVAYDEHCNLEDLGDVSASALKFMKSHGVI